VSGHIEPRWGSTPLSQVTHADVQKWIAGLDLAPATVRYIHRVLSLIMELAVRDGLDTEEPSNRRTAPPRGEAGQAIPVT
jgi:hypothetical protein